MADPFVAEIRIFPLGFAPRGWAFCNGQLMAIRQNTALFSLLGVTYGGDGANTFALPNMQGNVPMHPGQGPSLTRRSLGDTGGTETVTLDQSTMPRHSHALQADVLDIADTSAPGPQATLALSSGGALYQDASDGSVLGVGALEPTGAGGPHNNLQPFLALNFNIALQGVYPSRP